MLQHSLVVPFLVAFPCFGYRAGLKHKHLEFERCQFAATGPSSKKKSHKSGGIFGKASPADLDMIFGDVQI